jgi:hypothetical protein
MHFPAAHRPLTRFCLLWYLLLSSICHTRVQPLCVQGVMQQLAVYTFNHWLTSSPAGSVSGGSRLWLLLLAM